MLLNDFDFIKERLSLRQIDDQILQDLKHLASNFKAKKQALENLQEKQNKLSKEFSKVSDKDALKNELSINKIAIASAKEELTKLQNDLESSLFNIPNLPYKTTPKGSSELDNVVLRKKLDPIDFNFTPKSHWELAELNGWIDFERGVKLAKSRFSVLRGMGARLHFALVQFMLKHNFEAGFEIVQTPSIVNSKMLFGTGQLPKFEHDMFEINGDFEEEKHRLFLISTSEITLTNLFNDEILSKEDLPILLTTQTPCFRKEAGSAGKDTRGMIRQHQFDKVELVAICAPEDSVKIHKKMIDTASSILEKLELPHRLVQLCGGDLGFSASSTVDLEVFLPSQNTYREISSVSNCTDFQARRAKIRYKNDDKNTLVHTLNGSSLAIGRTLIAIMENFQQKDGSIKIPQVLKKYL